MTSIQQEEVTIRNIPLSQIDFAGKKVNVRYEREDQTSVGLQSLAQSIRIYGVLQAITLRKKGKDRYEVIAGNRRLRAAKLAGLEYIPAVFRTDLASVGAICKDLDDVQGRRVAFQENEQRSPYSAIEAAKALAEQYEDRGVPKGEAIRYVKQIHNIETYAKKSALSNSNYLTPNPQARPDNENAKRVQPTPEFEEVFRMAAKDPMEQYKLLQLVCQLPEEVQEIADKANLSRDKAILLTHTALRSHPHVQESLAYEMAKPHHITNKNNGKVIEKPKTRQECTNLVRQTIHDLQTGAMKKDGNGYVMDYDAREDVNETPELEAPFGVIEAMEYNQAIVKLIGKLIDRPLTKGEIEYKPEVYKPKIEELKKNLQNVKHDDKIWLANNSGILILVLKAIMESVK